MTNGGDDTIRDDLPDADQLEEDWNRALDAASGAVRAGDRAHALTSQDVSDETAQIHSHREWLGRFRPTLRKLFPRRARSRPPDA